jgi:multiple sugar transport system permease protein
LGGRRPPNLSEFQEYLLPKFRICLRGGCLRKRKNQILPYLLVSPALLFFIAIILVPVANAIIMSLQSYDLRRPASIGFIGLDNYIAVFQDPEFWGALLRTVIWVVSAVGSQFFFGFILALILNQDFRGRGFVRAVSLIPWVTPGVLIALMWRWIFDGNYGVINDLLLRVGLIENKIPFLAQKSTAFPAVVVAIIWQGIPFFAVMLLAGLQGIPGELYEAANIDGASGIQKLFSITIPSLKNTIFVTTLLRIIWVTNSVDIIYNMTEGGPAGSTQTLSVYIFLKGNQLNLGYSSTMAVLLAILLSLVAVSYLRQIVRQN